MTAAQASFIHDGSTEAEPRAASIIQTDAKVSVDTIVQWILRNASGLIALSVGPDRRRLICQNIKQR